MNKNTNLNKPIRLDGLEYQSLKEWLEWVSYNETTKGNIRVELRHVTTEQRYYKWLNDIEIMQFEQGLKAKLSITKFRPKPTV